MIVIEIADNQDHLQIDREWYRALAHHVFAAEAVTTAVLSIAFVDNTTIAGLNRRFLSHDYATDVLSFPLASPPAPLEGEVVISTERALEQCGHYGWPAHQETALYLVHGILHLCGYDDREPRAAAVMRQREQTLLATFLGPAVGRASAGPKEGAFPSLA